jgi:hypothetical protein
MLIPKREHRSVLLLVLISLIPVIAIYLPFAMHLQSFWEIPLKSSGMQQIFANWDGPNYVLNAITLYDPVEITKRPFLGRSELYYAAHFPLYSIFIRFLSPLFGYYWSAISVQLLSGFALNVAFYYWVKSHTKHPLWLTFAFTVFPPRYLILRAVIAPELFLVLCIIGALYFWQKDKPLLSGAIAFIAVLIKFQALIFVPVFLLALGEKWYRERKLKKNYLLSPLLPILGYGTIALFYQQKFGNWNAYFIAQKIAGLSSSIPFGMFNYTQKWVETGWMETAALYFVAMMILLVKLSRGYPRIYFWFTFCYIGMLSIIPQVDIMRLAMPLAPLFFLAFNEVLSSKPFKYGLLLSLPIIYLHAINFIMTNQAPIANWGLFR